MELVHKIAYTISAFNRQRKFDLFTQLINPSQDTSILDVGFSDEEYSASDNFLEKHYPYPQKITALGIDRSVKFAKRYPQVKAVQYNGLTFPFTDKEFQVGWSNAVLEHVGGYEKQLHFLRELKRTCQRVFLTTPNWYYPIEIHTRLPLLHFLPKSLFDKILRKIKLGWATGDYMNLLTYKKIKRLLSDAGIDNYKIVRNRLFFFTLDFVVVF
jgi:hypothetical protein